ncbi:MAG: [FeFe] hydrogenase H-cluster maturation GTPase HydF [Deltaproteobacteria bacterium]|nr:[FeFe] hydrogenase H-cluster maturation GTPase HydF [Deltaproteobacteria bacterium]MBN2670499.1 [FeFe] hydrogenase H-cluster maturation GTPase HydF [Deltaproteobacteria bacterium]
MAGKRTFKGFRLHIGLFGRRNVGKSSLLNAMTKQGASIVSDVAGTTTDPVEKPMEFLPLGPVLFIDTAGIDDEGALGEQRVQKTRRALDRTDLGVIVTDGRWTGFEQELLERFSGDGVPVVVVFNKIDVSPPDDQLIEKIAQQKIPVVRTAASRGDGILEVREALLEVAPEDYLGNIPIVSDLVQPGQTAVLVVPIDKEAPKGRLILPQVQTIRDLLDNDGAAMVVKERELRHVLSNFNTPPALIVTDSQAFLKVAADTPPEIPMTSFSILFSRFKGDLKLQVQGALAVESLRPGDKVLVAEACSHHPIGEDIGRVKIPRWLMQYVGGELDFHTVQGHDFPDDLSSYKLVIHCGGCMFNRRAMLSRLHKCITAGVPITNYGLVIAYSLGIFKRALAPFPEVRNLGAAPPTCSLSRDRSQLPKI